MRQNQMQVKPTEYQFERMPYSVMIETALKKPGAFAVKGLSKVDKSQLPSANNKYKHNLPSSEENNNFMRRNNKKLNQIWSTQVFQSSWEKRPVRIGPEGQQWKCNRYF
ncbi:Hypothetical_protein [Hexamita inflata]|nr:Hypothetical protein HINF_LOCUS58631 [Hexamita inflata]CAI9970989.1 Hypothetical protein HINF_LOCUS58634 [Hexamita inflata]